MDELAGTMIALIADKYMHGKSGYALPWRQMPSDVRDAWMKIAREFIAEVKAIEAVPQ